MGVLRCQLYMSNLRNGRVALSILGVIDHSSRRRGYAAAVLTFFPGPFTYRAVPAASAASAASVTPPGPLCWPPLWP